MAISGLKRKRKRSNIFVSYFIMFASIFLITFAVLGTALLIFVNKYSVDEKTKLLKENTQSIANSVSSTLIVNNMNASYSYEKEVICESLLVVSNCIESDVFVCDNEGKIILCKEQVGISPYYDASMVCTEHSSFKVDDNLIQRVYEDGEAMAVINIDDKEHYVVGTAIYAPTYAHGTSDIIGSVFATVESGTSEIVSTVLKIFVSVAVVCLLAGFIMIWILTKRMVTPLQQMSAAAKQFAVGDFSYRVKINSNDELADLGYAFNEMADALDKLENSRRSFVANVSHELKTPMTSIAGFIDGMLDGTIPKDKQDYYLKIVSDEVRRLSRLVVAMLNMSKMESGDFEMKPKNYNITDQIIHILLTFEQKIEKKNIEIRGLDDAKPHRVNADTDMIYQVIYNIFDNAVKFTNENGYIDISLLDSGDFVQVTIKNSGEGIDESELSRVFERFYKVDKSRSLDAKGAGLGLYIVKMIVEMHGGRIYAKSDNPNEAEFVFTLPKAK
ncbi:MAG: HAMP domain-containing histidine kinase [Ruminococcaceae bacterium]|nr:HAMP domain-containing histidine kinase [Oscillospiraceae bacterium]